jgi:hypothetical protein
VLAFWPEIIEPMLRALEPRTIVEIGSESGKTTLRLIDLARKIGAVVHAIDPEPRFDATRWEEEHAPHLVVHRAPSLDVLPTLESLDAVLVDGDHNWYTVYHELELIGARSRALGRPLPLILLHDVAWPYGRRDLYYAPERIPPADRQPWAKKGISPLRSELVPSGGFNAHLCHAEREGGPKNGVLTAVEDYCRTAGEPLQLVRVPAAFGLGILLPRALAARRPALAERVAVWAVPEVERFLERLELVRIAMLTGVGA